MPAGQVPALGPSGIQGFAEVYPGEGEKATATTLSGLRIIDPLTFHIALLGPFSLAPLILTSDVFDPLPKAFFRNPEAWRGGRRRP